MDEVVLPVIGIVLSCLFWAGIITIVAYLFGIQVDFWIVFIVLLLLVAAILFLIKKL